MGLKSEGGISGQYFICSTETNEIVGDVQIHSLSLLNNHCEIGCTVPPKHQGKGYCTESIKAIIRYIFEESNVNRIEIITSEINKPCMKVCEKLHLNQEAILREKTCIGGEYYNDVLFSILRKEYDTWLLSFF